MKKITLLTLIAGFLHLSSNAQLAKGSWMAGGSIGISYSSTTYAYGTYGTNQISIAPKAGYFFIDRLVGGLTLGTSFTQNSYQQTSSSPKGTTNNHTIGGGPFLRYYFLPTKKPANILLEVGDQYFTIGGDNYNHTHPHENSYGFAAGPAFFLNPSVALECTIGYTWYKGGGGLYAPGDSHVFLTSFGLQVYLGAKHHKS